MEQLSLLAQAADGRAILIIDSNQLQEKAAVRLELDGVADAGVPPRPRRTASGNVPQIHGEIERRLTEHSDAVKTLEVWPPTTIQPSSPRAHVRTRVPDMHCRG